MGERLAGGNVAIALLANTIATGAALLALILAFGPISGAHLNPAVTLADAMRAQYSFVQTQSLTCLSSAREELPERFFSHLMFGLPWYSLSLHSRHGMAFGSVRIHRHLRTPVGNLRMFPTSPRKPRRSPSPVTSLRHTGLPHQPRSPTPQ